MSTDVMLNFFLNIFMQTEEEQDEESLAEQYRGTPPLRTKKKKQHRYSHEISDQVLKTSVFYISFNKQFLRHCFKKLDHFTT